jgi:subtilisin family serine protease
VGDNFKFEWVVVDKVARKGVATDVPVAPNLGQRRVGHRFDGAELVAASPRMESMTVAEANEEFQSDKVAATLVNMPICLIKPKQRSVSAAPPSNALWGLTDIGADQSTLRGEGVVVAVLDTGIDKEHEAFRTVKDKIVPYNFTGVGTEQSVTDNEGHGTHCAGTIFGGEIGGVRIGVAPGVEKVLIGKVLGEGSGGDTRTLVRAINWAQFNGADVISMSLGMDFPGFIQRLMDRNRFELRRAASIALEAYRLNLEMFNKLSASVIGVPGLLEGTLVVGAAGNESEVPNFTIAASLPANALEFVSVAALSPPSGGTYSLAPFSNVGAKLGAPGVGIWSAKPGGGGTTMDGTSMAAPHVAGVACLWIQKLKSSGGPVNTPDVVDRLKTTAVSLAPAIGTESVRWGRAVAPA